MKKSKKPFPTKPQKNKDNYLIQIKLSDSMLKNIEKARKFWRENPLTEEMLEQLRKGKSVRVDAGRKKRHSSSTT